MMEQHLGRMMEFALRVKNMRNAQKRYFRTRDRDVMRESMAFESSVDGMMDEIIGIISNYMKTQGGSHA